LVFLVRVASVTVVFNSVQVVARHISALLAQTHPLTEIVIVDNGSCDGTPELLSREFPQVTVLELHENAGVGGAYAAGVEYAVGQGYDWIWLFDDDSLPQPEALHQLLEAQPIRHGNRVGAVACLPVNPETGRTYSGWLWRDRLVPVDPAVATQQYYFVDTVISSGTLLNRHAVEAVGLPIREYFMDFVDHEYNLRIRRAGFSIVVVRSSIMHHWIGKPRVVPFPDRSRLWSEQPAWRHYYMVRNQVATVCYALLTARAAMFLAASVMKQIGGILLLDCNKLPKLHMVLKGIADGLGRRLGKRVVPPKPTPQPPTAGGDIRTASC
jgi:GT2 family glycosyltransferase